MLLLIEGAIKFTIFDPVQVGTKTNATEYYGVVVPKPCPQNS